MDSSAAPPGYPAVSPYLMARDAEGLIGFIQAVFDGQLMLKLDHPDGTLMHAALRIGDSVVMVGGDATGIEHGPAHVHVYVADAVASVARAVAAGATIVQEPMRKSDDDDVRGGVRDASGTFWWIATP
jgi:uncharacterized glyoxalase superfamily protein PhnB